jgi:DNA polymerase IV
VLDELYPGKGTLASMSSEPVHSDGLSWTTSAILHVDLDAFFASVEQLDHPEWRGKPVIVGGDPTRRGVVSTASYEARKFGVGSAMPSARAAQLCPGAIWAPARFDRYRELSAQVMEILHQESPLVQKVSIDEAYLDVTPGRYTSEDPAVVAERVRARVAELGITCSVGVSAVKSVAKIASDHNKPDGITVVPPGTEREFLAPLPVRAMPGIGPRTADRLSELGIRTLGELSMLDEQTAVQVLGSSGFGLVARSQGRDTRTVHENQPAKSVSNERTFATDVRTPAEVDEALDILAEKVGNRLRRKEAAGRVVTVKLRFSDFSTRTVRRTLEAPTDDEAVFGPVARELVRAAWTPGIGLRLLGVGLSGFEDRGVQLGLDLDSPSAQIESDQKAETRRADLIRGVDKVRERFGSDSLRFGRDLRRSNEAEKKD